MPVARPSDSLLWLRSCTCPYWPGSTVICNDKELLYEEAPQAYKDVDSVVAALVDAGLVRLIARFRPLLTYKKGALAPCC